MEYIIPAFTKGTHDILTDEVIPKDAATSSLNWMTTSGAIELIRGRRVIGADGAAGKNYGEHTGFMVNGTAVRFRKVDSVIQYLNGSTWTDVITGLSLTDYTFANYQSLAGAFVFCFGIDGIYKIAVANPASYTSLYNSSKNFKGYGLIDKGRTLMWGIAKDPSGLYGSYIDAQNSTVYTTVTGEATAGTSGTLAFKGAGATRTCFAVQITITAGGQVYTDDYNGVLTGSLGGTGTINYTTGAWTVSAGGVGTVAYQWEDSNVKGVTDFTKSGTRLAGEGFILRQDAGGDAIKTVLPLDGSFFSIKARSCYQLTFDLADTSPDNIIFRTDIGVNTLRSAISTGLGILFMNVSNPSKPQLNILKKNALGDNFDVTPLFGHFDWSTYGYSDVVVDTWDKYILVSCTYDSANNNRLIFADIQAKTVDVSNYGARCFTKSGGYLYAGDSVSKTTYELLTGFDDLGLAPQNEWISRGELYGSEELKKTKYLRLKGKISPNQGIQVWVSTDNDDYTLVGTILGSGEYVDYSTTYAIGTVTPGSGTIGGDDDLSVYQYYASLKIKIGKFRKRQIKLVATGIGYVSVEYISDYAISMFGKRMPKKYRSKQNVSLDGTTTNIDNAMF